MYLLVGIRSGGQAKFSIGMSLNLNRRGCVMLMLIWMMQGGNGRYDKLKAVDNRALPR